MAKRTDTGVHAVTTGYLDYACMLLSHVCHILVDRQTLEFAGNGHGDSEVLWFVAIDLALIAQTGLRKGSRAQLISFWREHASEDTIVPMTGACSAVMFSP
jgi:hypothetical protein